MLGKPRSSRSRRRWRPTLITTMLTLAAQACSSAAERNPSAGGAGETSASAGSGSAGSPMIVVGGAPNTGGAACADDDLLADQAVTRLGIQRVFYSWTTDEQVAELRAGGPLFSRSESPGKGRGLAMTELAAFGATGSYPVQVLAATLAGTIFAKLRFSWTNPWATLMGWPGETYGNQLLQITLRPEAWIAVFRSERSQLTVYDANHEPVSIENALASPERIGAIYFQSSVGAESSYCGSFSQGAAAFREFVLGNLQMVQSWSLATPEIKARLEADIAALEAFRDKLSCHPLPPQVAWAQAAACVSSDSDFGVEGSMLNYDRALAIPSELYWPSPENIAALLAALKVSLPQGEPLRVTPGG